VLDQEAVSPDDDLLERRYALKRSEHRNFHGEAVHLGGRDCRKPRILGAGQSCTLRNGVNERAILLEMTDAATQFSAHVKTHERRGGPRQSALSRRSGRRGSRDGCHDGRPRDIEKYPRAWSQERYRQIVRWRSPDRGGHFPSLEVPGYFVKDLRDARTRRAALVGAAIALAATPFLPAGLPVLLALAAVVVTL